jgi:hypothetical protein
MSATPMRREVEADVERYREPTGWVGFIVFAGIMLIVVGSFNVIYGLVALFRDNVFVPTRGGLLVFDVTAWGWITLILGGLQFVVGLALFSGNILARVMGVILASLNAIAQLGFLTAQPVWSTIIIAVDVLIIYALTVHGREIAA